MKKLLEIWFKIKYWLFKSSVPLLSYYVNEEPEVLKPNEIYIVGESGQYWYICLLCPCGCGEVIQISTLSNDKPRWNFRKGGFYRITVAPSIWRTSGCKSHFFIRNGIVDWCKND